MTWTYDLLDPSSIVQIWENIITLGCGLPIFLHATLGLVALTVLVRYGVACIIGDRDAQIAILRATGMYRGDEGGRKR